MRYLRLSRIRRKLEVALQRGLLVLMAVPEWLRTQGDPWWWSTTVVQNLEPYWEAGRTEWYTWLLPITKGLPSSFAGWWYLQWWYGAGYYQYRFTLIAMVDNYRVVPLHAAGYLRWRGWWRDRAYPWLVKRYPRWGNLTSTFVWWAHHVVAEATTAGATRWWHQWTRAVTYRLGSPQPGVVRVSLGWWPARRVRRWRRRPVKKPWRPIRQVILWNPPPRLWRFHPGGSPGRWVTTRARVTRVGWSPVTHPGWTPPTEETTLTDEEWLTLDGVFPFSQFEPFQEDPHELLEDQQDDHHDDDEEPANPEDTLYGGGSGRVEYEDLDGWTWVDGYRILRHVDPLDMPRVPPYRLRTGVVTTFHAGTSRGWDNLVGGGDGPTPEDDDRDELAHDDNFYTEVVDWYTYVGGARLTDEDPPTNDWTGWWRGRKRSQPVGMVTRPDRLYMVDRVHPGWWLYPTRAYHLFYWKRLLRQWHSNWLRRPHHRSRLVAGPTRRVRSRRGPTYRFTRWKGWHRRRWDWWWWTWRRWPTRFAARYWRGWPTRRVATRRVTRSGMGWDFAQRHETHLEQEGLTLPGGWARWVLPRRHRLHVPPGHYPRYEPVHTGRAGPLRVGLSPWGEPERTTPVGGALLVGVILLDYMVGVALDVGTTPLGDPWFTPVGGPLPGAPHWWEHLRLAPPRGWWSWPGNPGVDANLYVWGWWADYYIPYLDATGEVVSPDYLPGSMTWRSFSDARHYRGRYKFYPSFPPWLPSYLSGDPRFHTLSSYGPDMWIPGEPHTLARTVNTRYMKGAGVPPMMYRALVSWYKLDEFEGLIHTSATDSWPTTMFLHLPNPTWMGPREYLGGGESPRMDARWLRAWGEITPYHNWIWVDNVKRALGWWTWGRLDWTNPWGWSAEYHARGWSALGGPTTWEIHHNRELLAGWSTTAAETYGARPRPGWWWWTPKVDLPSWVGPARWWCLTVGVGWWWGRIALLRGATPVTGVALQPRRRGGPPGGPPPPGCPRGAPPPRGAPRRRVSTWGGHPDGGGLRHRRNHEWRGIRKYDERHTLVEDYGFDWKWNGWYHYFEVARGGHNPLAPHRTRRAGPPTRVGGPRWTPTHSGPPTRVGRPRVVPTPTQVVYTPVGTSPTRVGGPEWVAHSGWTWLVRGVRHSGRVVRPDEPSYWPNDDRRDPRIVRRTSEISEFPGSLRRPVRRYYGVERRGFLDHSWRVGYHPGTARPTWRVTPGWWATRVVHHVGVTQWRTTLRGVVLPGWSTPVGLLAGAALAGVTWPGWTGLYAGGAPTPGYEVYLYEDDHNEMYLGLQPDDEFAEWGDLENPLPQHQGIRYLTPEAAATVVVTTPVWTLAGYPRGGTPGGYTGGYPATYFSEGAYPDGWMTWSPTGVDHPVYEVTTLVGYGPPRWYRRLTRWATPRWGRMPGPRRGGRPDWRGPWRRPRPPGLTGRSRVYEVYDPAGGDLLWNTPGAALVDELYQTGWVHQDDYPGGWSHDDWDTLPVGGCSGLGVGYRGEVYLTLGQRPRWDPTVWTTGGLNGGRYLLGGTTEVIDPEGVWLDWLGHDYDEPHTDVEGWAIDQGEGFDRAPEDPHENPNEGEYNEEIPRPRAGDLPGWVVAAAVAGVSPGEYDPTGMTDRLTTEVGHPAGAELGPRLDVRATAAYYRAWGRHRRGRRTPYRPWPARWFPFPDEDSGGAAGVMNPLYTGLHPVEVNHMLPAGVSRLGRDALLREHLRLWALTEVYFDEGVVGPRLNA